MYTLNWITNFVYTCYLSKTKNWKFPFSAVFTAIGFFPPSSLVKWEVLMCQLPKTEMITVTVLVAYHFIHGFTMHAHILLYTWKYIYLFSLEAPLVSRRREWIEKYFTWEATSGIWTLDCWFKVHCNWMPYCDNHMASSHNHAFIHAKKVSTCLVYWHVHTLEWFFQLSATNN